MTQAAGAGDHPKAPHAPKIKIAQVDGATVLRFAGDLTAAAFNVLKAGITRLFKEGKNRIILNLKDATAIDSDAIRGLAFLNITARELSGDIVLTHLSAEVRGKVKAFSREPVIGVFADDEQAARHYKDLESLPAGVDWKAMMEQKDAEIRSLKEQISRADPGKLAEAERASAELKSKAEILEAKLRELVIARRDPPDKQAMIDRIRALEASLAAVSPEAPAAAAKPTAPAPAPAKK